MNSSWNLHIPIKFNQYLDTNLALTPSVSNNIYYVWVNASYDFIDYLTSFVYDRALTSSVISAWLYLFFFMLALFFVVRFIFIRNK